MYLGERWYVIWWNFGIASHYDLWKLKLFYVEMSMIVFLDAIDPMTVEMDVYVVISYKLDSIYSITVEMDGI